MFLTDQIIHSTEDLPLCPCTEDEWARKRYLQEEGESNNNKTWEIVYTVCVLCVMFAALLSDRIGADSIMLAALTMFLAAEIISISESLAGFANAGLWTVMILFVVAEGIARTGALDWYLGKMLGTPKTPASAQLRLMIPIAIVSAFLNNTPVVVVMIPILQRWSRTIHLSVQQLLIPLSFASILGGTCTLIGTSTNLVVVGLLEERYDEATVSLFSLGQFGVPVAAIGIAYVLIASPFLLPGGQRNSSTANSPMENQDEILLPARLTQWAPAAGRTVKRSGLRDTGGIFLVSVHRAATGNVHRAVSEDFVLNVGDILYFTGLVETFGEFCEEHGLEVVTNEVESTLPPKVEEPSNEDHVPKLVKNTKNLPNIAEDLPLTVGFTKESLLRADERERLQSVNRMTDLIRGTGLGPDAPPAVQAKYKESRIEALSPGDPVKIVVTIDKDLVVVGINAPDRPGLLLDISKGLLRLNLQLHHTEAAVVGERSVSIWRCEVIENDIPDLEEIWSVLSALLSTEGGVEAIKKRGLRVVRVRVRKDSRIIGKTADEVQFRETYKAAIVSIQRQGKNTPPPLSAERFEVGDTLILQASDNSPLLNIPPEDFYKLLDAKGEKTSMSRSSSVQSFVNLLSRRKTSDADSYEPPHPAEAKPDRSEFEDGFQIGPEINSDFDEEKAVVDTSFIDNYVEMTEQETIWKDMELLTSDQDTDRQSREFLIAMEVSKGSKLAGKSAKEAGISKLPDVFLVSIDRPIVDSQGRAIRRPHLPDSSSLDGSSSIRTDNRAVRTIPNDEELKEHDVLWFAGPASAVGDLRKIPGLISHQNEEVQKINEKVFDRRLVQAVIAKKGSLVGKTVKEAMFRTRYGAAVLAVHREGQRVHEHPGMVRLQAGDVLLLEAGPGFIAKSSDNDRAFALLSEVQDSAPPRLSLLLPALIIAAGMLIVFTAGLTSLLVSALVASMLMIGLGILSEQEARNAMNWDAFITIGSAFGIGTALVNSGVAEAIANFLVDVGTAIGLGDAGLLGSVYFATFLISNVVTNNAAAALLFPIAMDAAEKTGVDRTLMSYSLMLGASASFMSPFGYTTNLLIYGPGGYKYRDFLVFGTPMQIVLWISTTAFLSVIEPWYISWFVSGALLVVVVIFRASSATFGLRK